MDQVTLATDTTSARVQEVFCMHITVSVVEDFFAFENSGGVQEKSAVSHSGVVDKGFDKSICFTNSCNGLPRFCIPFADSMIRDVF